MNNEPAKQPEPKAPEFRPGFYWGFVSLMLFKLGGVEAITVERLEQFDAEGDLPEVIYDHDKKAFVMKLKDKDGPVIIPVGGKILKRQRKILRGRLS